MHASLHSNCLSSLSIYLIIYRRYHCTTVPLYLYQSHSLTHQSISQIFWVLREGPCSGKSKVCQWKCRNPQEWSGAVLLYRSKENSGSTRGIFPPRARGVTGLHPPCTAWMIACWSLMDPWTSSRLKSGRWIPSLVLSLKPLNFSFQFLWMRCRELLLVSWRSNK